MTELDMTTEALRERLTETLAEWGAQMSLALTELEEARRKVGAAEQDTSEAARKLDELSERVVAQDNLIEALRAEAETASDLRRELGARDAELHRLASELDSQQALIDTLRRDADAAAQTKLDLERKAGELAELNREKQQLESELHQWRQRAKDLEEAADAESSEDAAEIESLRAELEARKTMIRTLRADSDRARTLEARLEEKRQLVQQLEATINRHASTIEELKRKAEAWRRRYRESKATDVISTTPDIASMTTTDAGSLTTTDVVSVTATGVPELPESLMHDTGAVDRTIAIDMRQALLEARRVARIGGDGSSS